MKPQQLRDVVTWSVDYHASLAGEYHSLAAGTEDQRLKLILDYLATHEKEIEKGLRDYLQTAPPNVLGTWSRSGPSLPQPALLEDLKSCLCCTSVAEITDLAIKIHSNLGDMYDQLVQCAEMDGQRELLEALRDHESAETRRMVRDIGRFETC